MKVLICDTETTGLEEPIGVVEVAWIELIQEEGDWTMANSFSSLVKSPYPMTCGAGGVNQIRDEDLVDAPTLEELPFPEGEICFVSHNVPFDRPLLEPYLDIMEELCTLLLSRRLIPGVENYKLGTLACACGLSRGLPHRAKFDTELVGELLIYMLQGTGWGLEKMIEYYKKPHRFKHMPFGKHAGELMEDVPISYLAWLSGQDLDRDTRTTVDYYLRRK